MDNLKEPATGFSGHFDGENTFSFNGFTKLELASLMAMQGLMSGRKDNILRAEYAEMAISSVLLAKAVIEEANK